MPCSPHIQDAGLVGPSMASLHPRPCMEGSPAPIIELSVHESTGGLAQPQRREGSLGVSGGQHSMTL